MALGPDIPRTPRKPVDTSKPCTTCRHAVRGWFLGFRGQCGNPIVREAIHRAADQGWIFPDYVEQEPDPVTGKTPAPYLPCSLIRSHHFRFGDKPQADANCGPEGRYWDEHH